MVLHQQDHLSIDTLIVLHLLKVLFHLVALDLVKAVLLQVIDLLNTPHNNAFLISELHLLFKGKILHHCMKKCRNHILLRPLALASIQDPALSLYRGDRQCHMEATGDKIKSREREVQLKRMEPSKLMKKYLIDYMSITTRGKVSVQLN